MGPFDVPHTQSTVALYSVGRQVRSTAVDRRYLQIIHLYNKKHLKNVGPIRHNEPPHAHSADVASGIVARRLRIDV